MAKERIRILIANVAAGVLIAFTLFFMFYSLISGIAMVNKLMPGFSVSYKGIFDSATAHTLTGYEKKGISYPRRLAAYDGREFTNSVEFMKYVESKPIGTLIEYKILYDVGRYQTEKIATMRFRWVDFFFSHVLFFALAVLFLITSVLVYVLKPNQTFSWAFLMFGLEFSLLHASIPMNKAFTNVFVAYFIEFVRIWTVVAFPAVLFHVAFTLFEEPRFFKGRPFRYLIFYLLSAIAWLFYWAFGRDFAFIAQYYIWAAAVVLGLFFSVGNGLWARYRSQDPLIRQRAKLLLTALSASCVGGGGHVVADDFNGFKCFGLIHAVAGPAASDSDRLRRLKVQPFRSG